MIDRKKLKVGDCVKCVGDKKRFYCEQQSEYRVTDISEYFFRINTDHESVTQVSNEDTINFEKVEYLWWKNLKVGDKVRCINNKGYEPDLTTDKVYEIIKHSHGYAILDNDLNWSFSLNERDHKLFEPVNDENKCTITFSNEGLEWFNSLTESKRSELVFTTESGRKYIGKFEREQLENNNQEDNKMEDITKFNKDNLITAKKLAIEKRNNYETRLAQSRYEELFDNKERLEREIKSLQEDLKEITAELKVFDGKKVK